MLARLAPDLLSSPRPFTDLGMERMGAGKRRYRGLLFVGLLWACFVPLSADAAKMPELLGTEPIVGDLKALEGPRPRLLDHLNAQARPYGVRFGLGYTTTVLGNPWGGADQGASYAGLMAFGVFLDLERWWGWSDTEVHISGSWATGASLTAEYIGNTINVSNVFSGEAARLYELTLETKFFDEQFEVRVGKISAGEYFAVNPLGAYFLNLSFDENPAALVYNDPAFAIDPIALWGVMGSLLLNDERWNIRAALYDASNPNQWDEYNRGIDFKFNPAEGMLFVGQIDYLYPHGAGEGSRGSHLSMGMFVDTGKRPLLADPTISQAGNVNFWLTAKHDFADFLSAQDQLTGFLTMTGAPQTSLNLLPFSVATGLAWAGILSERPSDALALGISYYLFSPYEPGQSYEIAVELAYTLKLTPWMTIQPDLQGVIRPSGTGQIPSALVVGFSTEIVF